MGFRQSPNTATYRTTIHGGNLKDEQDRRHPESVRFIRIKFDCVGKSLQSTGVTGQGYHYNSAEVLRGLVFLNNDCRTTASLGMATRWSKVHGDNVTVVQRSSRSASVANHAIIPACSQRATSSSNMRAESTAGASTAVAR